MHVGRPSGAPVTFQPARAEEKDIDAQPARKPETLIPESFGDAWVCWGSNYN